MKTRFDQNQASVFHAMENELDWMLSDYELEEHLSEMNTNFRSALDFRTTLLFEELESVNKHLQSTQY